MFSNDRNTLRKFYYDAWHKHVNQSVLTPLEAQIIAVILKHPEYQAFIADIEQHEKDFPEANPFLHLGLHLAIQEQVSTDRPAGIRMLHHKLCEKFNDAHQAEHYMMECLAQAINDAQIAGTAPDEKLYLENLKRIT